jgi:threonyl-tRNA synthetase
VQLDFQLPLRFDLQYQTEVHDEEKHQQALQQDPKLKQGHERPVMIHRAILGSVERMFAILTEHFAAKWPFWLSPRQVMVVPISQVSLSYAQEVRAKLRRHHLHADVDTTDRKMQKKVAEASEAKFYNYILVVGEQEKQAGTVNVRTRDRKVLGMFSLDDVAEIFLKEKQSRSLVSCFPAQENGKAQHNAAPAKAAAAAHKAAQQDGSQFDKNRVN